METVKRPSCKWKGQTCADDNYRRARVARLAECHNKQKAGYSQDATPTLNIISATLSKTSPAIEYWQSELATRASTTKELYLKQFYKFIEYANKTPDELLKQRTVDQINTDPKTQRRIESLLVKFIAKGKDDGLAPATLQIQFAAVRSFFEIHYYPLRMRKGDYPKGDSIGVRAATKETILKAIENKETKNKVAIRALILFLKDSALRGSDVRALNYGDIAEPLEKGEIFIALIKITKKQKKIAKAFIGPEAVQALKQYIEARKNGTRRWTTMGPD